MSYWSRSFNEQSKQPKKLWRSITTQRGTNTVKNQKSEPTDGRRSSQFLQQQGCVSTVSYWRYACVSTVSYWRYACVSTASYWRYACRVQSATIASNLWQFRTILGSWNRKDNPGNLNQVLLVEPTADTYSDEVISRASSFRSSSVCAIRYSRKAVCRSVNAAPSSHNASRRLVLTEGEVKKNYRPISSLTFM